MPILEIISAETPKDIKAFTQRLSAVFAEMIGKPEAVSVFLDYSMINMGIPT